MPCDCFLLCLGAHRDGDGGRVLPLLKKASAGAFLSCSVTFLVLLVIFLFCPMVFLRFEKKGSRQTEPYRHIPTFQRVQGMAMLDPEGSGCEKRAPRLSFVDSSLTRHLFAAYKMKM